MSAKKKVQVITMGCSKNLVDSEKLMYQLASSGYEVTDKDFDGYTDVVVINTCGFIGDAKEESIDMILRCVEAKHDGRIGQLIVMGCLSERYKEDLVQEIPEVDDYFGVSDFQDLVHRIGGRYYGENLTHRVQTTPKHYAYLKIAEGCNHFCSFCAIPNIRGRYVSVPMEDLIEEAKLLATNGVKELLLIAQDLTSYGLDINGEYLLPELVEQLSKIDGIAWIRLHYGYPTDFPLDLLRVMRDNKKVCKYLDLPFQHISTSVLDNMHRHINSQQTYALIEKIRKEVPGIALRTTLMVGFPNETESDFDQLKDFVKNVKFERMGAFAYSHEENTFAGEHFEDNVSAHQKQSRIDMLMDIQQDISLTINQSKIGQVFDTIIDYDDEDYYYGRTQFDSPEVDNEVLILKTTLKQPLLIGEIYPITIVEATEFELSGRLM